MGSSYIDDLVQDSVAYTRLECAPLNQIHLPPKKLGEVLLKPEKSKDPWHFGEFDQDVHVTFFVLLAAPARTEYADGPYMIGLLQEPLSLPENADDPRTFSAGLACDSIHS